MTALAPSKIVYCIIFGASSVSIWTSLQRSVLTDMHAACVPSSSPELMASIAKRRRMPK